MLQFERSIHFNTHKNINIIFDILEYVIQKKLLFK